MKFLTITLLFLLPTFTFFAQTAPRPEQLRGLSLRSIGPGSMSGRITAIAVDPAKPECLYAGAASGGVWRSRSGGMAWEPIFDQAPTQSIGSIALNPRNAEDIWVGTGEGNPRNSQNFGAGIFRTLDGGRSWTCMGLKDSKAIHRIIVHRDNPEIVFAAVIGSAYGPNAERGVFKTSDGGKTWRKVLFVNDQTGCAELVADPSNPNKLFAAMWEYRRWPWNFKSGGKGSGLYVTYDGGETWKRRTEADGLPEGELGRIGLAVSRSNPDVVYALVEAKDNALYKSTDGGRSFRKMADKGMGDRPFYYAEIYVDPMNENRVYSIHTVITRSDDGGKTFETWVGGQVHPDHHAFWGSPNDSDYMIEGNDGGLNITHDGGRTWQFAENIPVGQFYHIDVDNDQPYNIYGGLQDNGTWVGPSSVWKAGGLRNSNWQEILYGDGFDAMPQKDDNRFAFGMSQGGEVYRVDRQTGRNEYIKPVHPEAKELRFNWNAGMAQDPHRDHGIYFGSQYLHYSSDLGRSWQIISPDLTTNDTSKLHQDKSGGLTPDATNAENHCTIIAISPSPAQAGVVWVGTDDGNVQLTRDGGKTWENCSPRMTGLPKAPWIPQIEVSVKNPGEAFVVVNNYRQNDWAPYLYHTTDYGKTWKEMVGKYGKEMAFTLSVTQDPEVPSLLFLGTDQGLWYSLDYGNTWVHWTNLSTRETGGKDQYIAGSGGLPSVPVYDMKIQARDADLVLGTFGRSIWVFDDLEALRDLARAKTENLLDRPFKLFSPQPGIQAAWASVNGPRFGAGTLYSGQNRGTNLRIPFWVKPTPPKKEMPKEEEAKGKKAKGKDQKGKTQKPEKPTEKRVVKVQGDESAALDTLKNKDALKAAAAGAKDPETLEKEQEAKAKEAEQSGQKPDAESKGKKEKQKATVTILSMQGDTLRRFKINVDTGFAHINWNFDTRGVRRPGGDIPEADADEPGGGPQVMPGTYKVVAALGKDRDSVLVRILPDPRLPLNDAERQARNNAVRDFYKTIERATRAYDRLREAEKTLKLVEDQFAQSAPDSIKKEIGKLIKPLRDSIGVLKEVFMPQKELKGIQRNPNYLNSRLDEALEYLNSTPNADNAAARVMVDKAKSEVDKTLARINALFAEPWQNFRTKVEAMRASPFKNYDRL